MIKLSEILFEETRYKKETGKSLPNWQEKLKEYEQSKDYYVHFSNVPRVALYIVNEFETPIGFYSYPLDFSKMENFAVNRPYAIIFKIKSAANILDLKNYDLNQYNSDLAKLKTKYKISNEKIEEWEKKAKIQSYAGFIWNITRMLSIEGVKNTVSEAYNIPDTNPEARDIKPLSAEEQLKKDKHKEKIMASYHNKDPNVRGGGKTGKWTMILNKVLGYDGAIDDCLKIIHYDEPCQTVIFNTNMIDIKDIIKITEKIETKDEISTVKLNYSNLDFSGKNLSQQNWTRASLVKINLSNADISNSNLIRANLKDANLTGANFEETNLTGANLTNADLESANLRATNLTGANLTNANLAHAKLYRAILTNAILSDVHLGGADLSNADLHGADLRDADLENANIYYADLGGANLKDANLRGTNLEDADIRNANLTGADLTRANLTGAIMRDASLWDANLQQAILKETNLIGVILTGANLDGAILTDASYNKDTKFPDGFNPKQAGMKIRQY